MHKRAKLSDILEAIDFQSDESRAYFDCQTGRIEVIADWDVRAAEDSDEDDEFDDDAPQWQRESIELARAIEADEEDRFVPLSDRFEIHEWDMMRRFADREVADADAADALSNAIHGPGAFRYFKDELYRLGLIDQWHAYRDGQYREIAVDWCERNGIEIEPEDEDDKSRPGGGSS